jgi:type II secretory pathway pseudopilin PulG
VSILSGILERVDTELQSSTAIPQPSGQPSNKVPSNTHHLVFGLLSLAVLIVGMSMVYLWQHHKVNELNTQLNNYQDALVKDSKISLDNLNALTALPNTVVDTTNSPTDLIAFLGADNTQCYKGNGSGYYKVVAQANDQFAKMQYGCTAKDGTSPLGASPAFILAKKTNNKWGLISPTNQWLPINGQDEPSCPMVNNNKVSKLVTPQCWQGPALSSSNSTNNQQRAVISVTNP